MNRRDLRAECQSALVRAREFEERLSRADITVTSPCGQVRVTLDPAGDPQRIDIEPKSPGAVTVDRLEALLATTLNAAVAAETQARERFYAALTIAGDTVTNWRRHPPPSHHPVAFVLAALRAFSAQSSVKRRLRRSGDHV